MSRTPARRCLACLALSLLLSSCGGGGTAGDATDTVRGPAGPGEEAQAAPDPVLDAPGTGRSRGVVYTALESVAPMRFVAIDGGEFTMGSPEWEEGHQPWEGPRHRVRVEPFLIARTEVTEDHWRTVLPGEGGGSGSPLPMAGILWCDALRFANALSLAEGLEPAYGGVAGCAPDREGEVTWDTEANGFRLPTEQEWEYAARAGTSTRYWAGERVEDVLRVGNLDASGSSTIPVAQKADNPWGLYDVHGNVWEWVWDPFRLYSDGSLATPVVARNGERRVLRGGGFWHGSLRGARSASRHALLEGRPGRDWCRDTGVRLALDGIPEVDP